MPRIPNDEPNGNGQVRERLALNVFDLDRVDPMIREMMLAGKLDLSAGAIRIDKERGDEQAVAFSCDLLTGACIADTLRSHDRRAGDYPTRVYLFKQSWQKLPSTAVLTKVIRGKVVLSPEFFAVEIPKAKAGPPKIRKVSLLAEDS